MPRPAGEETPAAGIAGKKRDTQVLGALSPGVSQIYRHYAPAQPQPWARGLAGVRRSRSSSFRCRAAAETWRVRSK